jgi:hypothetical protein
MTEDKLDKLINSVRETYRVPPEPDLEGMWDEIDAELDVRMNGSRREQGGRGFAWRQAGLAAAAALVIGVGVGRWSAPTASEGVIATAPTELDHAVQQVSYQIPEALQRTATSYLGETAALLKEVQSNPNGAYTTQAMALLSTTRLLLDSPAATDEKLNGLLQDLELILARIAMLRNGSNGNSEDLQMIRSALVDRDVVPRVHTAAVTIGADED